MAAEGSGTHQRGLDAAEEGQHILGVCRSEVGPLRPLLVLAADLQHQLQRPAHAHVVEYVGRELRHSRRRISLRSREDQEDMTR